jgi:hypothetical protein
MTRDRIETLLDQMIALQRRKVVQIAKDLDPRFSEDDLLNPHDFPKLAEDMDFNYQDGVLNGVMGVLTAFRAEWARERSGDAI